VGRCALACLTFARHFAFIFAFRRNIFPSPDHAPDRGVSNRVFWSVRFGIGVAAEISLARLCSEALSSTVRRAASWHHYMSQTTLSSCEVDWSLFECRRA
jgi:hypothetical protein